MLIQEHVLLGKITVTLIGWFTVRRSLCTWMVRSSLDLFCQSEGLATWDYYRWSSDQRPYIREIGTFNSQYGGSGELSLSFRIKQLIRNWQSHHLVFRTSQIFRYYRSSCPSKLGTFSEVWPKFWQSSIKDHKKVILVKLIEYSFPHFHNDNMERSLKQEINFFLNRMFWMFSENIQK